MFQGTVSRNFPWLSLKALSSRGAAAIAAHLPPSAAARATSPHRTQLGPTSRPRPSLSTPPHRSPCSTPGRGRCGYVAALKALKKAAGGWTLHGPAALRPDPQPRGRPGRLSPHDQIRPQGHPRRRSPLCGRSPSAPPEKPVSATPDECDSASPDDIVTFKPVSDGAHVANRG